MNVKDLLQYPFWNNCEEECSDIVLTTRIRLARNLSKYPFVHQCQEEQKKEIVAYLKEQMEQVLPMSSGDHDLCAYFDLNSLSDVEKLFLVEHFVVSKEHMDMKGPRSVAVFPKEHMSVMFNEEDHLRLQSVRPGFCLESAWADMNGFDDLLTQKMDIAYSSQWGYLTACPTNVGTGMRASVMLHLPCLTMTNQITKIFEAVSKLGLTVRGMYGEGSNSNGHIYQLSNQVTLGLSEEEIVDNLSRIIKRIIEHEYTVREQLLQKKQTELEDKVYRAYAVLKAARMMSYGEMINLLSFLWLGYGLKMLTHVKINTIYELFLLSQPAHLQLYSGQVLKANERDKYRAELIRTKLG